MKVQQQESNRSSKDEEDQSKYFHKESMNSYNSEEYDFKEIKEEENKSRSDSDDNHPPQRTSLLDEFKMSNYNVVDSKSNVKKSFAGFNNYDMGKEDDEPNWFELYENALRKHNKFIKEVHFLMQKNIDNSKKLVKKR